MLFVFLRRLCAGIMVSWVLAFSMAWAQWPTHLEALNLSDGQVSKLKLKGERPTVLLFLSIRCPCSQSYEGYIKELAHQFTDMQFIAVHSNSNEPLDQALEYFQKLQLPFPVLRDDKHVIADYFGALKTPHAYVLSKDADLLFSGGVGNSNNRGRMSQEYLKQALLSVREGKKPDPSQVRVLGCLIAR